MTGLSRQESWWGQKRILKLNRLSSEGAKRPMNEIQCARFTRRLIWCVRPQLSTRLQQVSTRGLSRYSCLYSILKTMTLRSSYSLIWTFPESLDKLSSLRNMILESAFKHGKADNVQLISLHKAYYECKVYHIHRKLLAWGAGSVQKENTFVTIK